MAVKEPMSANDYDDRTTAAVKSVLLEIGQILGSFQGKFAVVGGAVPWLLLSESEMPHIGTIDVDLALDPVALADGEYATLAESLIKHGYHQRSGLRKFQLVRTLNMRDGGPDLDIIVDFLMPRHAEIVKNRPPLVSGFAVQPAYGVDLGLEFSQLVAVEGDMPEGGNNRVHIAVASIPALLVMKGYAIVGREKHKDAYDIYYCIRNFPDGAEALAEATLPLLDIETARIGYKNIAQKFRHVDDFGPTCVASFLEGSEAAGERTSEQWRQDAFGQVHAWLTRLGMSSE